MSETNEFFAWYFEPPGPSSSIKPGETFATGMVRPKTTALFFDKLWVPDVLISKFVKDRSPQFYIPSELCIESPIGVIEYTVGMWENLPIPMRERDVKLTEFTHDIVIILTKSIEHSSEPVQYRGDHDSQPLDFIDDLLDKATTVNRNQVIKELVTEYKKIGIHLTPIYLTPTKYDEIKIVEEQEGVEICLDFIPNVLDEKLTWEQVLEFRKDKKAKQKLDRLRRWFHIDLLNKTKEEIKNILGQKFDDYQWALKKHGIETVIGGSTSIMSFASGPALLNLLTESPLAIVSGGVAIGAGALAWIGKKMIEKQEIKRDPVAYIYEVRKLEEKAPNK